MPSGEELLKANFGERRYLLRPWLREREACMVYAATGVGKSLFALSASMAIAGSGEFLGWKPDAAPNGGWRVLYVDGEMHIADIQERYRRLREGMAELDKETADRNMRWLARTQQEPGTQFPSITEDAGRVFVLNRIQNDKFDVVVLDNFSTLGEVEDENDAASFNPIQEFLLQLKTAQVATILVHHANKAGDNFRGSTKLAATFDSIIQLERPDVAYKDNGGYRVRVTADPGKACFRVKWDKDRSGKSRPKSVIAALQSEEQFGGNDDTPLTWEFFETGAGLDELAQLLPVGHFATKKEIGDYYRITPPAAAKWLEKGIKYGLWNDYQIDCWLAHGKDLRKRGKTEAPVRLEKSWRDEADEGEPITF
jgi:KaiC/GvpD/RAD55 family RecA-like ATPase